ncbi:C3HC zinc finger-like protein [Citrus sinensis]|uniref:C3HC zinc finger-like protein n=1 Tax=Citrus sinensis TaxID=2711 RepID=A0ACB8LY17_CITSI|nr:C3HC zinc finger-like protein [Citrus sinensis]
MEVSLSRSILMAEKLISLCGWEPRSLPYVVDCEDGVNQFVDDVNGQNPSVNVHSAGSKEIVEVTEDYGAHKSVVLDCRLCGASVGLWAFATVARPVEFFRVVGDTEVNGENHCGSHVSGNENHVGNMEVAMNTVSNGEPSHTESSSHLNLTIAGGPPPTKQNFKATISFPVVGRALRAKFSYDSDFRDYTFDHPKEIQSTSRNNNLPEEGKDHTEKNLTGQVVLAEDAGSLNRGQYDHGSDSSINEETLGKENNDHAPLEGPSVTGQDTFPGAGTGCAIVQSSTETTQNEKLGQSQSDMLAENGEQSKNEGSLVIPSGSAVMAGSAGMDPKQLQEVNAMKFDPIRQHRHFCPWIVSTGGALPGWQQTLSALHRQRAGSYSSPADSSPSSSLIKVDDPIASVRKLFTSPVAKRMKSTHGSS